MCGNDDKSSWWVVVGEFVEEYVSVAVRAKSEDLARDKGEDVLKEKGGCEPCNISRVTGPYPVLVRTDERERRPSKCCGCGLNRYCGNHPPTPRQTWWEIDRVDDGDDMWQCINCGVLTVKPRN